MSRKRSPILRKIPLSSAIKLVLSKHVVLLQVINIIINMDDIIQEKSNEGPILKSNKRLE